MKTLKQIGIAFGSIITLVFIVGLFFSSTVVVEREASVRAPQELVYFAINNLEHFKTWNPWTSSLEQPNVQIETNAAGEPSMTWEVTNENGGRGEWVVVENQYPKYIKALLTFPEEEPGVNIFELEQGDNNMVRIRWAVELDMGWNPFYRVLGKLMDMMAGPFVENGLLLLGNEAMKLSSEIKWGYLESNQAGSSFVSFTDMKSNPTGLEVVCGGDEQALRAELDPFFLPGEVAQFATVVPQDTTQEEMKVCLVLRN